MKGHTIRINIIYGDTEMLLYMVGRLQTPKRYQKSKGKYDASNINQQIVAIYFYGIPDLPKM